MLLSYAQAWSTYRRALPYLGVSFAWVILKSGATVKFGAHQVHVLEYQYYLLPKEIFCLLFTLKEKPKNSIYRGSFEGCAAYTLWKERAVGLHSAGKCTRCPDLVAARKGRSKLARMQLRPS